MEKLLTFISQFVKVFSPPLFTKSLDKLIPVMSKCQNVWASYHLTKKVQNVDPVIERFPEHVHKKSARNPHPMYIHFKFWAAWSLYLNKPVTTGPPLSCVDIVNRISYSTKNTIVRGVVATMGGYTSYQPKPTVGVPFAGGKPLPFSSLLSVWQQPSPNRWIPYVSQLESNISKLPLWQFWFYHSGLCNLHPKLCVCWVFWFGIWEFSWISKHRGLNLLQSNRFLP